jgi:RNA polymerase sigma factor (sigma-70 family)
MEALRIDSTASRQLDDGEIVKRVVAGEKALFEILLRRYNQTLFRVVRSYLRDENEVQDAMQNAYLKAFDKLHQFQGHAAFSTWLIRIGINEALLRLKDMKKEKTIYLQPDYTNAEKINQIADKQLNPEKMIIRQETKRILEHAIDMLPEKYRVIYILKEIEGLSNSQVMESLDITDANI